MERSSAAPSRIRCAIYTRKSTEEGLDQEFNSLQAQREAAEAYIQSQKHLGWVLVKTDYDDGGFSGGNLERPALQRLLDDIDAYRVDCVVVYKVDRLSRSLLDFARLIDRFDKRSVSFVSVTQQFNTTSSLGRLTLNILLSFAQFEREIISERTRDKMSAARKKGKWVGGCLPLGYDVDPKGGRLVVNPAEAKQVREIYGLFQKLGSIQAVVAELERRRWKSKAWTAKSGRQMGNRTYLDRSLRLLLINAVYAGKVEYRGEMYQGEHPAIVDLRVWEQVNAKLRANHGKERAQYTHQDALLAGRLFCRTCDKNMAVTYAVKRGMRYRYYLCATAKVSGWDACATKSISAQVIEDSVVEHLKTVLVEAQTRTELDVTDSEVGALQNDDFADLIRRLVRRVTFDGSTSNVVLELARTTDAHGVITHAYKVPRRSTVLTATVTPPPRGKTLVKAPRLARLLALSHKLENLVRSGTIKDYTEVARLGHVSTSRLSQILRLLHLDPRIQERILFMEPWEDGAISERELRAIASETTWQRQRSLFAVRFPSLAHPAKPREDVRHAVNR
jgi:DNA invertase Pin-like site-specific DNA recombinase